MDTIPCPNCQSPITHQNENPLFATCPECQHRLIFFKTGGDEALAFVGMTLAPYGQPDQSPPVFQGYPLTPGD